MDRQAESWRQEETRKSQVRQQAEMEWRQQEDQRQAKQVESERQSKAQKEVETEAVNLFRKATAQGNADAQNNLGVAYFNGQGVAKDEAKAVKWFRKAADQGDANAQNNLGVAYANGQGVAKDYAEAVKWYRKAADQGDANPQNNLGAAYANGQGVAKDYAEAVKWFRKAADQGDAYAKNNLGAAYANGHGVAKDEAEAVKWFRKAAAQGNANAKESLASRERQAKAAPPVLATSQRSGDLSVDRYQIHGDGTVTDTKTKLMWKRCSEGQEWKGSTCQGSASKITWNDAMPNFKQKSWPTFAAHGDWRVPTKDELATLVYCSSGKPEFWPSKRCEGDYARPTLIQSVFPNTPLSIFWSSSLYADYSSYAWYVYFNLGDVNYSHRSGNSAVRLVRGGQ